MLRAVLVGFTWGTLAFAAASDLWLARVGPAMSTQERERYSSLRSEEEREGFRDSFWTGKSVSAEEYFNRVEHVDLKFGSGKPGSGANTDQGRIYLALGPPTSILQLTSSRILVPLEVWRYDHVPGLSISSEIQLLFFQAPGVGFPKLYSPQLHTLRSLIIQNAGTRGAFPVNDIVTANDLHNRLRLSPTELEVVDAAMTVARGVRGSGNSEILFEVQSPARMLNKPLTAKVQSRVLSAAERPVFSSVQSRTQDRVPAIDITVDAVVKRSIGLEVEGLERTATKASFDAPAELTYSQRLYLLPGDWSVTVVVDGLRFNYPVSVKPVSDDQPLATNVKPEAQWTSLGRQYLRGNDLPRAALCFRKSLEASRTADALAGYGRMLALTGKLDEARAHLIEALQLQPAHYEALVALGTVTARFGDNALATDYLRQANAIQASPQVEATIRRLNASTRPVTP